MAEVNVYDGTASLPIPFWWQALDFMRIVWPSIYSGENRLHPGIYPEEFHPTHFVVAEGDVLISYATVVWMQSGHLEQTYRVAGLGNVLTYPSFRGEGYGTQAVRAATRYIEASDADIAALFCQPSLARFYARHGWEAMERTVTLTGPRSDPAPYDALRMMIFVSEKGREAWEAFENQPWYVESAW